MRQPYRVFSLLAIVFLLAACGEQPQQIVSFDKYDAQSVLDGLKNAGLNIVNERRDMQVPPGVPATFNERYLFEIERIAPAGGQLLTFNSADNMQAWQRYVEGQRASSSTRRDFVYVYNRDNALLVLSPALTTDEAAAYRTAFERLP